MLMPIIKPHSARSQAAIHNTQGASLILATRFP
jgi:hypothetical protein